MVYTPRRYLIPAAAALVALQMQQTAASSLYYDPVTTSGTTDEISSKFPARGGKVADADCAITVEVDPTLPNITTISNVPVTYTDLLANMTSAPTEAVSTKVGTTIIQESTPSTEADQDAYTTTTTTTSTSTTQSTTTQTSSTSSSSGTTTSSQTKTGTTVSQTSTSTSTTTKTGTTTTAPISTEAATDAPATTAPVSTEAATDAPAATTASPSKTGTTTTTDAPAATTSSDVGGVSDEEPNCATGWEDQSNRKLRHAPMSGRKLQEKIEKKRRLESNSNKDIAKLEAYFGTSMETTLDNLPTVGVHTPSPWPGPYWPTYQDSINVVWSSGEPSAAEKYATAFGLDVDDFMDKVSKDNGIDSMSSHTKCSSDTDCSSLTDGSSCAIRVGKSSGYCIPTWYGICHAWTPASMLEAEPNCAVTHNGVTFQPLDLKALLSDIYDGATVSTVFTGTRFNGGTDSTDEYGRHSSDSYRDLNPAYFHIAAANLLGNLNATFIADVTAGSEVWNQPVRGFKVYEQTAMSLEEAAQTFYGLEEYPWNAAAKSIVYVKTRLSWIFETYTDGPLVSSGKVDSYTTGAYYYYLLEMDDAGAIIGGEWVYGSDDDHPDFLWFPKAKPAANTVTSIGLSYADVSMLLEKSVACSGSSSGSESAGSSASASASASSSTSSSSFGSASTVASTSGSASSLPGSTSSGSAPFTSSTAASTGSENAATVAPVTETPVATETSTSTTTAPASTAATPASTTAIPASTTSTPASTTANTGGNNHNDDSSDDNQQQQQQGQRQTWQSFFHWW